MPGIASCRRWATGLRGLADGAAQDGVGGGAAHGLLRERVRAPRVYPPRVVPRRLRRRRRARRQVDQGAEEAFACQ
jgi:hypothetical protein